MTRIAIVGAGTMGRLHAESCLNLPDAQVTWVADRHAERAEALAALLGAGCRATTDNAEAVSADDVDAVLVCVPTSAHREVTELAAARGKHVFCEKPLARTLADAEAMVEACRRAGVRLMVGHVVRFFPEYARIHELLREDAVGQVGVVRASRVNAYPRPDRGWYTDLDACGGPIVDLMIHDLDTLRWYFGEVARVYGRGLSYTAAQPMTDYALALLRFESGVIAHLEASWAHATFRTAIEIYGQHGALRHASEESAAIRLERVGTEEIRAAVQVPSSPLAEGPYQTELRHFLACLRDGAPFLVDGEEAVRSLALALAVLESVRTGRPVHLGERGARTGDPLAGGERGTGARGGQLDERGPGAPEEPQRPANAPRSSAFRAPSSAFLKVGILSFAHQHANGYAECLRGLPGVELAAIADDDPERGRRAASEFGADYHRDYRELLARPEIAAVLVCSANAQHREMTVAAAAVRKHVLCEKPLATTRADALAMIEACREQGVQLGTAFPMRFSPPVLALREALAAGAVGTPLAVMATNPGTVQSGWFVDPDLAGGGATIDHTVHVADLLRWLFGREIARVYAEIDTRISPGLPVDDVGVLMLDLEGGLPASLDASWEKPKSWPIWGGLTMDVVGDRGVIAMDAFRQNLQRFDNRGRQYRLVPWAEGGDPGLIAAFVEAVRTGAPFPVTGEDGLKALEVALCAYESARRHEPVACPGGLL